MVIITKKRRKKEGTEKEEEQERKQKVLRLPRNKDEKEHCISIIPRDHIPLSKHTVGCERHWPRGYVTKQDYGKKDLSTHHLFLHVLNQARFQLLLHLHDQVHQNALLKVEI